MEPSEPPRAPGAVDGPAPSSPYRNLWVPLIVVPALIVVVLVLIFLLFGAIAGEQSTVSDNLRDVVSGGANERGQALFALARKFVENGEARRAGRPEPWPIDRSGIATELRAAWERVPKEDYAIRTVLASLLAQLADPQGVPYLVSMLEISDADDPDVAVRFAVLANLVQTDSEAMADERVAAAFERLATHQDHDLRSFAIVALRKLPPERARPGLVRALSDRYLQMRLNAAVGLAENGDAAGREVLIDCLEPGVYAAERRERPERWTRGAEISTARQQALKALGRLAVPADRELALRLAEQGEDPNLKGVALEVLRSWGSGK